MCKPRTGNYSKRHAMLWINFVQRIALVCAIREMYQPSTLEDQGENRADSAGPLRSCPFGHHCFNCAVQWTQVFY